MCGFFALEPAHIKRCQYNLANNFRGRSAARVLLVLAKRKSRVCECPAFSICIVFVFVWFEVFRFCRLLCRCEHLSTAKSNHKYDASLCNMQVFLSTKLVHFLYILPQLSTIAALPYSIRGMKLTYNHSSFLTWYWECIILPKIYNVYDDKEAPMQCQLALSLNLPQRAYAITH